MLRGSTVSSKGEHIKTHSTPLVQSHGIDNNF